MSLEDRHWYKEDFNRRMGRDNGKKEQGNGNTAQKPEAKQTDAQPKKKPKIERVEKREPNYSESRVYNNAPPAHTILAAKYELAIRRRTQKTFWAGFAIGAVVACVATALLIPLV